MSGIHETKGTSNSSVLKTTTWGALIALSATIMVAGLVGYNPWSQAGNLSAPNASIADKGLPTATQPTLSAKGSPSFGHLQGKAPAFHGRPSPAETGVAPVHVSTAASPKNPIRSNQADLSQPSALNHRYRPVQG